MQLIKRNFIVFSMLVLFIANLQPVIMQAESLPQKFISALKLTYYNPKFLSRYVEYAKTNDSMDYETIITNVNIGLDKEYYTDVNLNNAADSILVVCNKYNKLDESFVPKDLTSIGGGMKLAKEAAVAFEEMRAALKENGYSLTVRSTYRSFATQKDIYNRNVKIYGKETAEATIAHPGHSEHQTGLAIDVVQAGFKGSPLSNAKFQDTKQYEWLLANGHKYGFILRYPKDKEYVTGYSFEPWHWRYIGVETATYMFENKIATFDEYCATRNYETVDAK